MWSLRVINGHKTRYSNALMTLMTRKPLVPIIKIIGSIGRIREPPVLRDETNRKHGGWLPVIL